VLNPDLINADARMKDPRTKKTAVLPNLEYTLVAVSTPNKGNITIAKRLVIISGTTFVIHQITQTIRIARATIPEELKPSGGGMTSESSVIIPETAKIELRKNCL